MTAHSAIEAVVPARAAEAGWRPHLVALAAAAAAILFLFRRDAADMAGIWWNASTYNHCALVPVIIGWLVWQRLPELRQLQPSPWAPGLLLVGAGALLWLLGDAGGVGLARHTALILMLQGSTVACLGPTIARALAFPIFYALFMIPVGDEIVPLMQTVTAAMCMALLGVVGIPAHIEGIFITTPNGYFEVAEACAGVKFLVAMVAYGALVANVCFRSWTRRILFMLAAVAIPVVANGVRAWGTIYIASITGSDFASSFDHVVYGWVFFAIVIALLMAAGWPFFDRKVGDSWFDPRKLQPAAPRARSPIPAASAAAGLAALPLLWSAAIASAGAQAPPAALVLPEVPGWTRAEATAGRSWQPHFAGADLIRIGRYRDPQGREVDLALAVFARQSEGRELIGYGQGAVGPDSDWAWTAAGTPPPGGRLDRIATHGIVREVATFYRVGEVLTGREVDAKLETVKVRLLGGPQRAVAVLVSAQAPAEGMSPRPAIDAFLSALGPIAPLADRAAGLPGAR
jgi:exosortase A